ncbi:MAG: hypothetical protein V7K33_33280 [Nostoc sp.]
MLGCLINLRLFSPEIIAGKLLVDFLLHNSHPQQLIADVEI